MLRLLGRENTWWQFSMMIGLEIIHAMLCILIFWNAAWYPSWLRTGRKVVQVSLLPLHIISGFQCPIVVIQGLIMGQETWFARPFLLRYGEWLLRREISPLAFMIGVIGIEGAVLVWGIVRWRR